MRTDIPRALLVALLGSLAAAPLGACGDDATSSGSGGGGGAGTGGGPGSGGGIVDPGLTAPFLCELGTEPFEALRQDLGLDSIERRQQAADTGDVETVIEVGTPCATATDVPVCELAVLDARSEESLFSICGGCFDAQEYLVTTEADDVGIVANRTAMLGWLGTVDAPAKAWLVATQADYRAQCGEPWIREDGADHLLLTRFQLSDCPIQDAEVLLRVHPDGSYEEVERVVLPETGGCAGRRPEGLAARDRPTAESSLGATFARMAYLEAASIDAFHILRDELAAHGAPPALIRRAEIAAEDEVRHAATMSALAVRHGAVVTPPDVTRGPVRSLEAMALENAREGCVREAYGALEAMWQARFAADDGTRRVFETIAEEEAQHAALSWDLAAWFDSQLDDAARARVVAAREAEVAVLAAELRDRRTTDETQTVGVPTAARATSLLSQLQVTLA